MLVIIIGLPASGKTTYYENNYKFKNFKIHDDFISSFYDGFLIEDLLNGFDVCITEPRLCNYERFIKFMEIFKKVIDKKEITVIIFKNDKNNCLINSKKRNETAKTTKVVERTIEFYSNSYDTDKFINELKINEINYKLVDVYSH
jgi:tRNA uridine 5-carbamoylmethylation protein Kti12